MLRKSVNGRYLIPDMSTEKAKIVARSILANMAREHERWGFKVTEERLESVTGCILLMSRSGGEFDTGAILDLAGCGVPYEEVLTRYGTLNGFLELQLSLAQIFKANMHGLYLDDGSTILP